MDEAQMERAMTGRGEPDVAGFGDVDGAGDPEACVYAERVLTARKPAGATR
jgi:hypothetical protein